MKLYVIENNQLKITLSEVGASWLSCLVKLQNEWREVLVTTMPAQWHKQSAYFGATIGRYANRIAHGQYRLNGKTFYLAQNNGENNLHGGNVGADKCRWTLKYRNEQAITFRKIFANGEEGFGGEVVAAVTYRLQGNRLEVEYHAQSTEDTPLCLTNHAYFNLSNAPTIHDHRLQLNSAYYLPVAENGIPNAPLQAVENSGFDFRKAKTLGQDLLKDDDQKRVKGYDHAFLLATHPLDTTACEWAAILAVEDLTLSVATTYPALQLYTGNWLAGQPNLVGGDYADYAGVALEPGFLPDTPNHLEWWQMGGISRAGEPYHHRIVYEFQPILPSLVSQS